MVIEKDMNMDLQPGQGHAAWTRICSMDMDMQNTVYMGMQHGHGHTACTGHAAGHGHAACTEHAAWAWIRTC
jgi:hypothetical protein